MLSVLETLKAALVLWGQNFRYVVILTLVVGTPTTLLNYGITAVSPNFLWILLLSLLSFILALFTQAFGSAAMLGLLRREELGMSAWAAARSSVTTYIWTLLRLQFLIMLIALAVGIVVGFSTALFGFNKYLSVVIAILYLVLIKYALGDPLVVIEHRRARDALSTSWKMTRGHFWYVLGCYLFLGSLTWLVVWSFTSEDGNLSPWLDLLSQLIMPSWPILAWCMYLRIKEVDATPPAFQPLPQTEPVY